MVCHMKTTLDIDDTVMRELEHKAARQGRCELPPLPTFHGGGFLVDIADRDALYRAMEEDEPIDPVA